MNYILMIWTVVAMAGDRHGIGGMTYGWRPLAEFQSASHTSQKLCEDAAHQLGLKSDIYRCVRSK